MVRKSRPKDFLWNYIEIYYASGEGSEGTPRNTKGSRKPVFMLWGGTFTDLVYAVLCSRPQVPVSLEKLGFQGEEGDVWNALHCAQVVLNKWMYLHTQLLKQTKSVPLLSEKNYLSHFRN